MEACHPGKKVTCHTVGHPGHHGATQGPVNVLTWDFGWPPASRCPTASRPNHQQQEALSEGTGTAARRLRLPRAWHTPPAASWDAESPWRSLLPGTRSSEPGCQPSLLPRRPRGRVTGPGRHRGWVPHLRSQSQSPGRGKKQRGPSSSPSPPLSPHVHACYLSTPCSCVGAHVKTTPFEQLPCPTPPKGPSV